MTPGTLLGHRYTQSHIHTIHTISHTIHTISHTPGTQIHTIHTIHTLHTLHALHTLHTISHTIHTISRTPHAHTHRWVVEGATWVKGEYWREGDWTCIDRHTNNTCFRDLALQVCVSLSYRSVSLCHTGVCLCVNGRVGWWLCMLVRLCPCQCVGVGSKLTVDVKKKKHVCTRCYSRCYSQC